jgi:hypothetical protein
MVIYYLFKTFPMLYLHHNWLAIYNEAVVYIGCIMMVAFTDYVTDPEVRYYLGQPYLLWLACVLVLVNFTVLFYDLSHSLIRKFK